MEIDWKAIFAHPLMNMLFGALIGYIPMHIKDKRELAAKERLAAEERVYARENERQVKAYDERKKAYRDYIYALENVFYAIPSDNYQKQMDLARISHSTLELFCSETVKSEALRAINALADVVHKAKYSIKLEQLSKDHLETAKIFIVAFDKLVSAMRQDLGVHKTELC